MTDSSLLILPAGQKLHVWMDTIGILTACVIEYNRLIEYLIYVQPQISWLFAEYLDKSNLEYACHPLLLLQSHCCYYYSAAWYPKS